MSVTFNPLPETLQQTDTCLLYKQPKTLYVDGDSSTPHSTTKELMNSLRKNGPLIACGSFGPQAYKSPPSKLDDFINNQDVYSWDSEIGQRRIRSHILLLGMHKSNKQSQVLFSHGI